MLTQIKKNRSITLMLTALLVATPALAMRAPHDQHHDGKTELHILAGTKDHASYVLEILKIYGAQEAHARDIYGNTPLHEASYYGCTRSAQHLLDYGADINAVNKNGHTPLDKAISGNQQAAQRLIIQHGGARGGQNYAPRTSQPNSGRVEQAPQQKKQPQQAPRSEQAQPAGNGRFPIAPCIFNEEDLLHLPGLTGGAIKLPGVYHVYSQAPVAEEQDWACAFHALDNMRILEHIVCNREITRETFIRACRRHASDPGDGSDCAEQYKIAKQMGLPYMINLEINDQGRQTEIVFKSNARYEDIGTKEEQRQKWQELRQRFAAPGPICIHFCAGIISTSAENPRHSEGHGLTISVTKNDLGQVAMYIFDNVNEDEAMKSQKAIRRHVEFIYQKLIG